jgi:hypothetical protein
MAITVEEQVKQKIANAKKWREANPEIWHNQIFKKKDPKIYITKELLNSLAYRSLSRNAMLLYQDFLAKRDMRPIGGGKWHCENNGAIIFPVTEAVEKGYSRDQFRNGIDELQAKGLLDITHQGKGGRKPLKGMSDVSLYWIDTRWREYGTDDFRPPRNPRKKDTRQGRGWALLMNNPKRKKEIIRKRNETIRKKS